MEDHEGGKAYGSTAVRKECLAGFEKDGGVIIRVATKARYPRDLAAGYAQHAAKEASAWVDRGSVYMNIVPMGITAYNRGRGVLWNEIHFVQQCEDRGLGRHICGDVMEMEVLWAMHLVFQVKPYLGEHVGNGIKRYCKTMQECDAFKQNLWSSRTVADLPDIYKRTTTCSQCTAKNFYTFMHGFSKCTTGHIPRHK